VATEGSPTYYREKAAETRAHAEKVVDGEMKRQLLDVAATYERLATYSEEQKWPAERTK
jgi:hypothetical protein